MSSDLAAPPLISTLIQEYRTKVDEVLAALDPNDCDVTVDALFALRFLLSSKTRDVAEAIKNAKATLEWRRANRTMLAAAAAGNLPHGDTFAQFVKTGYAGVLGGHHPVFVVRAGIADTHGLMRALPHEQCVEYLLAQNEKGFRLCDKLSRETGRLCKMVIVIDGAHMSLFRFDRRFPKAQGASSHLSAMYYPCVPLQKKTHTKKPELAAAQALTRANARKRRQLLGRSVMVNPPAFFKMLWSIFSLLMSATHREKFALCGATKTWEHSASACPFLSSFGPGQDAAVPAFLGGTLPVPPSLAASPPY